MLLLQRFVLIIFIHDLFIQVKFLNPLITRKPKLRRQRKIFRQQGKIPRPDQMNINVATWGRLLKKNINMSKSVQDSSRASDGGTGRNCICYDNLDAKRLEKAINVIQHCPLLCKETTDLVGLVTSWGSSFYRLVQFRLRLMIAPKGQSP